MSELSAADVREIARLARLRLGDDEVERLRRELGAILDHMAELAALDTSGVEPMTHAVPMQMRLRADEAGESLPVERAVGPAPARDGDFFEVPAVIGAEES